MQGLNTDRYPEIMPLDAAAAPAVSIVLRTRNRPEFLTQALLDVGRQEFADIEVIIVNDGDDQDAVSDALSAVSEIAQKSVVVDRTGMKHGRARAANAGLRRARGEFIVLHDDDDTWAPDFLKDAVDYLRRHPLAAGIAAHTEVVITRLDPMSGQTSEQRLLLTPEARVVTIQDMVRENRITTHSLVFRSRLLDEIGYFDEELQAHEDWDFYLRLVAAATAAIELLPLPARAYWHHRPDAIGDASNSVFALDDVHLTEQERIRDAHLRRTVEREGLGGALHLAAEVQRLERRIGELSETNANNVAALSAQLADADAQMSRLLEAVNGVGLRVDAIGPLIVERTSFGSFVRRIRHLARR